MDSFIIVFTYRLNIGLTAIPYHAVSCANSPIELIEHVTPEHISENPERYHKDEIQAVKLLHTISDKQLFKRFSRESSLRDFKNNIPEKVLREHIRPDIERTMYKLVRFLGNSEVTAYFKQSGYSNLYLSDALQIPATPCQPIFRIDIENEEMFYSLKFKQDDSLITFHNQQPEVICSEPAVLKTGHKIYFFEKFDSGKLRPFTDKSLVYLKGQRVIDTYMEKFISKVVERFEVEGSGFKIVNAGSIPYITLHLEKSLTLTPVLRFKFRYGKRTIEANRKTEVFIEMEKKGDLYVFNRFPRDFETEKRVFRLLENNGLEHFDEISFVHPIDASEAGVPGPDNLVEWITNHKALLKEHNITPFLEFEGESFNTISSKVQMNIKKESMDWFDISCDIEIPPHLIPFSRFRRHILDGDRRFVLPDGKIFIIPRAWFSRYTDMFNFGKTEGEKIVLPRAYYHLIDTLNKDEEATFVQATEMPELKEFEEVSLPDGLMATLRPYQTAGYQWLLFLQQNNFGGILADDMGLGKTLQAIAMLLKTYSENDTKINETGTGQLSLFASKVEGFNKSGLPPSLIVMPTSLIHNWDNEIKKFAPFIKTYIYTGGKRAKTKELWKILRHYHVVITTYGILRNDVEYFSQKQWKYLILDESQNIKNPSSKSYDAVSEIKASHYLALTGTPIENSLTDLWAQMNIVNEGLLKSLNFFKRYYETPISKREDEAKSEHLQKIINPFMLRRSKEMVAEDLPPVMEQVVYCDMSPEQKEIYENQKSGIRNQIFETIENSRPNEQAIIALQGLSKLRQLANHPVMVDPGFKGSSGKFDQIMDSLESIISENHHVLVFSSFVKDLQLMEAEMKLRGINYAKLIGSTQKREKVIDRFNSDDNVKVFLISLKAGGVGLNLTKADYVFMLNPWWNPAAESQAINRAHRIGQTRNVFVYRFISTETIEEKIALLQEKKSKLANAFVNTTNPLSQMSSEEIRELFS
jgi:superfamily II DNA or RNA helicase